MLAEQTWVLTGAAGQIASSLRPALAVRVGRLRLVGVLPVRPEHPREESIVADLRDQDAVTEALADAHGVVHLGGLADEADFTTWRRSTSSARSTFRGGPPAGGRRVAYASSNRVTGFYPTTTQVEPDMPPRPDGLYGVSKIAGEALGRLYADKFGLQVACVRIGSFEQTPQDERQLSTWLSPADCAAAFLAAMAAPDITYTTFYAVSRNTRRWWGLASGESLGFEPHDDAEQYAADVYIERRATPGAPQGGTYASAAYTLDRQR